MTLTPVSLDTTPADTLLVWKGNAMTKAELIAAVVESQMLLAQAILATSSPPAPQEDRPPYTLAAIMAVAESGDIPRARSMFNASVQFTSAVTPAVPDHAGLVTRLEELVGYFMSGNSIRRSTGKMDCHCTECGRFSDDLEANGHANECAVVVIQEAIAALRPPGGDPHE